MPPFRPARSETTSEFPLAISTDQQDNPPVHGEWVGYFRQVAQAVDRLRSSDLAKRVTELRERICHLERIKTPHSGNGTNGSASGKVVDMPPLSRMAPTSPRVNGTLLARTLSYLDEHFTDPQLSSVGIARAVGANDKYLAHTFATRVGERMHVYISKHRVRRACELLVETDSSIEEIAARSGFAGAPQLRRTFRKHIGVSPTEYRRIFVQPAAE
jgi:AraC-like DNA-binding protein